MRGNTPRTLIYCQTRKQCSVLFRIFEVFLGHGIFQGTIKPQNRIVEMYHASSGMRTFRTLSDLASDWLMGKWSVLIGREKRSRD